MKFIITGRHASGKYEVLDALEKYGVKVGHEFCTIDEMPKNLYIDPHYIRYSADEIIKMFENNAYLYMAGTDELDITNSNEITRGISQYTFDESDVLALGPQQLICMNRSVLRNEDMCIVWLDNNISQRIQRHSMEERTYNFEDIEDIESDYDKDFVSTIYAVSKNNLLYFSNEDPQRVALIVRVIIEHPQYLNDFVKIFS